MYEATAICGPSEFRNNSLIARLSERKKRAEQELTRINEAIEAIDKNPDLAKLVDALHGLGF